MKNPELENDIGLEQLSQFADIIEELNLQCQNRFSRQCENLGINEAEMRCLRLFCHDRYLTSTAIATRLGVAKSRVTLIVRGLVKQGFLDKMQDPNDSRVQLLSLSSMGQQKCKEMREQVERINRTILEQLSREQRGALLAMLSMLKGAMGAAASIVQGQE